MRSVFNIAPAWEVGLFKQNGDPAALFDAFESFNIQRKLNGISTFAITFKDNGDVRLGGGYWEIDGQIQFKRDLPYYRDDRGKSYFADVELSGLVRKITRGVSEGGEKIITYEGLSCEHLLARRVIAALEGTTRADKDAPADYVMCEYVYENCGEGATADAGRQFVAVDGTALEDPIIIDAPGVMPGFMVDFPTDGGIAPTWTGSRSMENLLEVLQDISRAKNVDFRVEYINGAMFFFTVHPNYGIGHNRTWEGLDPYSGENAFGYRPVVFSIESENVTNVEAILDRINEGNFVFILGQGDMSTRNVYPAGDTAGIIESPWNQIEVVRSASDQDFLYQLKDAANEALAELAYKETIKFTPHQIPKALYGEHYFIGDFVTVDYEFFTATQRIVGVDFTYDSNGERIELELENIASASTLIPPAQPAQYLEYIPIVASASLSISASASHSESPSASPSASVSPSVSPSVSQSPSVSPSVSPSLSPSASVSPSVSPSIVFEGQSPSVSPSVSPSPSFGVESVSPSVSPSASVSPSPSRSVSSSPSRSVSPSLSVSSSVSPSPEPLAFDTYSDESGSDDMAWTHTPITSTPRGVLVIIEQGGDHTDVVTNVTYGGNALSRVAFNSKATGEEGAVYVYFVGTGVPTGASTVRVYISASGEYHATCITISGSSNTHVQDYDTSINSDSIANPVCTLNLGAHMGVCAIGFMSGQTVGNVSPRKDWTDTGEDNRGTYTNGCYIYDIVDSDDVTAGIVQTSDDAIAIAVAVVET